VANPIIPAPVPPQGGRYTKIVSPKLGVPEKGIVLSRAVLGVETHFIDGRTSPCLGREGGCVGCAERAGKRWKGYLFGHSQTHHCSCLFEIPADSVRRTALLNGGAADLRGYQIELVRVGPQPNSRVLVRLRPDRDAQAKSGPEPDILSHLSHIWGLGNPFPRVNPEPVTDEEVPLPDDEDEGDNE